jgi:hypothetical protein
MHSTAFVFILNFLDSAYTTFLILLVDPSGVCVTSPCQVLQVILSSLRSSIRCQILR